MKNLICPLLISFALFTSCDNLDDGINQSVTIKAYHDFATRVTFDGQQSSWESDDVLNVVVDGLNDVYTFRNTSSDTFVCDNIPLTSSSNNIYAFCGANPNNIDISGKTALVQLGATTQIQNSQNPTSHISEYDILYGAAMGVGKDNISISMKHSVCVLKVNITNSFQQSQTIKSVTVTTPDNVAITGDYNISLDANNSLSAVENSGSNSVTVTFDEIELLGVKSSSFTAWLAVAPFTLGSGDKLTIDVTTSDNTVYRCTKTITEQAGKTFKAGNVMSTSVVLGENAVSNSPSEVEYTMDMSILASCCRFPVGEDNGIKEGEYTINGYTFKFQSPTTFYLDSNNRINFAGGGIKNSNPAMIELPQKAGYRLSLVTLASDDVCNDRYYIYTIAYYKNSTLVSDGKKYMTSSPQEFDLSGVDMPANTTYYIWIGNRNDGNSNSAILSHISLKYTKL